MPLNLTLPPSKQDVAGMLRPFAPADSGVKDMGYPLGDLLRYGAIPNVRTTAAAAANLFALQKAIAAVQDVGGVVTAHRGDEYWFGSIGVNQTLLTVTARVEIDWNWARIAVAGVDDVTATGSTFICFRDCVDGAAMRNYVFEDTTFDPFVSVGRGVLPFLILSDAVDSRGFRMGPMHVVAGQAVVACANAAFPVPTGKRAYDVEVVSPATADKVTYMAMLSQNGFGVRGSIRAQSMARMCIAYDVQDVDLELRAGDTPVPDSACLLISTYGVVDTQNIRIRGVLDAQVSPVEVIENVTFSGGNGVLRHIDLDISAATSTLGLNPVVVVGSVNNGTGTFAASSNLTIDDLNIRYRSATPPATMLQVMTASPNYGVIRFPETPHQRSQVGNQFTLQRGGRFGRTSSSFVLQTAITAITRANPAVVTSAGHGRVAGERVAIVGVGGMTQVNGRIFVVANPTTNTFELQSVDSSAYGAFTAGGTVNTTVRFALSKIFHQQASLGSYVAQLKYGSQDVAHMAYESYALHTSTNGTPAITLVGSTLLESSIIGGAGPSVTPLIDGTDLHFAILGIATTAGYAEAWIGELAG